MPQTAFAMAIITDTCDVHLFYRYALYLWFKKNEKGKETTGCYSLFLKEKNLLQIQPVPHIITDV
jgi:hypothetical protein